MGETEYWRVADHVCWRWEDEIPVPEGRKITRVRCPRCGRSIPSYQISREEFEARRTGSTD